MPPKKTTPAASQGSEGSTDRENTSSMQLPASVWQSSKSISPRTTLQENLEVDVCVVGGGIAGMTAAYLLASEGKSVVVIEKNVIGQGETAHTTAHLSNAMDHSYRETARLHGEKGARLAAASHTAAISQIESIVAVEKIECDFERLDGYLFLGRQDTDENLKEEADAACRAGLTVRHLEHSPSGLKLGPCLHFPQQAQFHPLKYLAGLANAIERHGGRIYEHTEAAEIKGGSAAQVSTKNGHTLSARAVLVATNTPINDRVTMHTKQAAYRSYAIAVEVPANSIPNALYWDTEDPFHYVRLQDISDKSDVRTFLIIGGEDHKTGQADELENRFARLLAWGRTYFHGLQEPAFQWSGQVMESMDGLAFIGRNPGDDNTYIATGDSGMGFTHGTIAGILVRDLILGRENPWITLYDPSRKSLRATPEFAKENLNVVAQYVSWATPGEVSSADEIKHGTGAILRHGMSKIAVYRDGAGQLHERSAVCPHLGCIVSWNSTERSWDCPCHGSRFDTNGAVLNGPTTDPLEQVSVDGKTQAAKSAR